jgi:hypothetical protein
MAFQELFSEAKTELNREVTRHPKLVEAIRPVPQDDFPQMLGHICAFCGIVVDGHYSEDDLEKLYDILIKRLREKRTIHIPGDQDKVD